MQSAPTYSRAKSTSLLAQSLGLSSRHLFNRFLEAGWITREGDHWQLTKLGRELGGAYQKSPRFGTYIAWPDSIRNSTLLRSIRAPAVVEDPCTKRLTATALGKQFGISVTRVNHLLSELGWIQKGIKGWVLTSQGTKIGGSQREDHRSGIPYVSWPSAITDNAIFKGGILELSGHGAQTEDAPLESPQHEPAEFREKFPAQHRATDGHFVRSKAEMLIDNWLYMAEIVHAYERKLPVEEDVYCDFYIPTGKVYIEYWGYEKDPRYLARKTEKLVIYERYAFKLIQLAEKDVQSLDDVLPRLLLKHGIRSY